jgi:chromosome partitioning protein
MNTLTGPQLRSIREEMHLDQYQFADHLNSSLGRGYDNKRISRWETGAERVPKKVAAFLNGATPARLDRPVSHPRKAVVIAIANQKGGVGKTATAVNLAYLLANAGWATLLIDNDPQANATAHMGINAFFYDDTGQTLYAALRRNVGLSDLAVEIPNVPDLKIVPASIRLAEAEVELQAEPHGDLVLREKIDEIRSDYDFIIIDCTPNLGKLSINALSAANAVLIPCQTESLALRGVGFLFSTIEKIRRRANPELEINGIIPTLFDRRNSQDRDTLAEMQSLYGKKVTIYVPIPRATVYAQAAAAGCPALQADPQIAGSETFDEIARSFINTVTATLEVADGTAK